MGLTAKRWTTARQPLRDIINHNAIKSVVAETLGLTVEELDAARDVETTLVHQAITHEEITQEQADVLIERFSNSGFPLGGRGQHRGDHGDDAAADTNDETDIGDTSGKNGSAAARGDTPTASTLFLPLVTR